MIGMALIGVALLSGCLKDERLPDYQGWVSDSWDGHTIADAKVTAYKPSLGSGFWGVSYDEVEQVVTDESGGFQFSREIDASVVAACGDGYANSPYFDLSNDGIQPINLKLKPWCYVSITLVDADEPTPNMSRILIENDDFRFDFDSVYDGAVKVDRGFSATQFTTLSVTENDNSNNPYEITVELIRNDTAFVTLEY